MSDTPAMNPLAILLTHDRWATNGLFAAATTLDEESLHRRFNIGLGSLHDTLAHLVSSTRRWTFKLAGDVGPNGFDIATRRTVPELRAMYDEVAAILERESRSMEGTISAERDGVTRVFPRGVIVAHLITHAMHHRAQALNMLRQLEVEPLPMSAVTQWSWCTQNGTRSGELREPPRDRFLGN